MKIWLGIAQHSKVWCGIARNANWLFYLVWRSESVVHHGLLAWYGRHGMMMLSADLASKSMDIWREYSKVKQGLLAWRYPVQYSPARNSSRTSNSSYF